MRYLSMILLALAALLLAPLAALHAADTITIPVDPPAIVFSPANACGWSGWINKGDNPPGDVPGYYVVTNSHNGAGGQYDDAASRWNKIDGTLAAKNGLMGGLHPNDRGHANFAAKIIPQVMTILDSGSK